MKAIALDFIDLFTRNLAVSMAFALKIIGILYLAFEFTDYLNFALAAIPCLIFFGFLSKVVYSELRAFFKRAGE